MGHTIDRGVLCVPSYKTIPHEVCFDGFNGPDYARIVRGKKADQRRHQDAGVEVSLRVESHLQQPVLGIVSLPTTGTDQIATPGGTLMIVGLRYGKRCPATAGDQEHAQRRLTFRTLFGLALARHDSSTVANELFLRLFDCRVFLRSRSDLGVISTNSSSAMNSMACSRFNGRKGTRRIASSAVEARMFVSFFSRTAFTSRSVSLAFSPMIMPSYSSTPGPKKSSPRSCKPHRAYAVDTPPRSAISAPVSR